MAVKKPAQGKKYFTVTEANATLPLVRAIVRDITELARDLRERHERLARVRPSQRGTLGEAYQEELQQVQAEFDRDQERMQEYEQELKNLGRRAEGLLHRPDRFPRWMDDHEVYLCWRLGEAEVAHWHELDAGFAGRQKLLAGRDEPLISDGDTLHACTGRLSAVVRGPGRLLRLHPPGDGQA